MVSNKVNGLSPLDKLYRQAKKNVGTGNLPLSANLHTESSYIRWKQKIHKEYYRLIKEAGIYIEGA